MTLYKYQALNDEGKKVSGMIDADSLNSAQERLNQQKILILQLKEYQNKTTVPKQSVILFTQELCRLLKAGLALYEALQIMEEKYRGSKTHPLFLNLLEKIKRGEKLSKAISQESVFSPLYRAMIANAEKTGDLIDSLEELSTLLSKQNKLKKQIVSALVYPGILLSFCLFVLTALLYYVIPSLAELFQGKQLHPMTSFVLGLSNFMINNGVIILFSSLFAVSFVIGLFIYSKTKRAIVQFLLSLPFVRSLFYNMSLIRFARALGTLIKGGVSFVKAISLSKEVLTHPKLQTKIKEVEEGIIEGKKFSSLLSDSNSFPPLFVRLLAIAEESGKMDLMLFQIAHIYEEEVEKTITRFTTVLQPLLLIVMGILVGFILLSVLLPLTDMNSFI